MYWIASIIACILSAICLVALLFVIKKRSGGQAKSQLAELESEANELYAKLDARMSDSKKFASRPQLEGIVAELNELTAGIESQKANLKEIETKLDKAQKDVETKESEQQETKSSKEEDEAKLQELLASYQNVSGESVSLEQELAFSLKNLDTIMSEMTMTDDQKGVLLELSETLTNSGSRLRDLITDYKAVNERLEGLKLQHADLEMEYTKLVEQQLGA